MHILDQPIHEIKNSTFKKKHGCREPKFYIKQYLDLKEAKKSIFGSCSVLWNIFYSWYKPIFMDFVSQPIHEMKDSTIFYKKDGFREPKFVAKFY